MSIRILRQLEHWRDGLGLKTRRLSNVVVPQRATVLPVTGCKQ